MMGTAPASPSPNRATAAKRPPFSNRTMFWRIIRRLLSANRGRLIVMLLALGAGAAVTAALLNLQVDAKRRITTEFAAFGPNVVISPKTQQQGSASDVTLDQSIIARIPKDGDGKRPRTASLLFAIAQVSSSKPGSPVTQAVVTGYDGSTPLGGSASGLASFFVLPLNKVMKKADRFCFVGSDVAKQLRDAIPLKLIVTIGDTQNSCNPVALPSTGGPEDSQVIMDLATVQDLTGLKGRISTVQLVATGKPSEINQYIDALRQRLSDADVRPIRQFTEGEAKIYSRISGVLTATVALVLVLTALCVMAAMTNVAMERKNDVGLMKAIGGATRRVLRLFLTEAALLGLTSGIVGAALGILLSIWLGKAVFGVAARPRLIVYPVAVALTTIVAIAGAYPLRRLGNVRPASVFRGEA